LRLRRCGTTPHPKRRQPGKAARRKRGPSNGTLPRRQTRHRAEQHRQFGTSDPAGLVPWRRLDYSPPNNARYFEPNPWRSRTDLDKNLTERKDEISNSLRTEGSGLDQIDAAILRELVADARLPRAELARRVGLSAPSVGDRVRRLEDIGVITGYAAQIDPSKLGYGLTILIRARPLPGEMRNMIQAIRDTPQIVSCDRVSGDDCFVVRAHVRNVLEMESVIDRIVPFGATNSSIVQSAPFPPRMVEL